MLFYIFSLSYDYIMQRTKTREASFQKLFTVTDLRQIGVNITKSENRKQVGSQPKKTQLQFDCHLQRLRSDCMEAVELQEYFIYIFAQNKDKSKLVMYLFEKADGRNQKIVVEEFNNTITCMKIFQHFSESRQGENKEKLKKKCNFKLVIGFKDGFVKMMDLKEKPSIDSIRLDVKPVQYILQGGYKRFHHNIGFALMADSFIYIFDLSKLQVIQVLRPPVVMCDMALSISLHSQSPYLLQATQGGYLIFWKIQKIMEQFRGNQQIDEKMGRRYSVFPDIMNHAIAIKGLIWCDFYGSLVILITQEGVLRIVAICTEVQNQFLSLLEYPLQNSQNISSTLFFPEKDTLLISKNFKGKSYIQQIELDSELKVKSVITIFIDKLDILNDFYLSNNFNILMCRGSKYFVIGLYPAEEQQNSKEDNLRHY